MTFVPVVDLSASPKAQLRPVSLASVRLNDQFWQPRRERNRTVTLPSQWARMEETGRLENFRRSARWLRGETVSEPFQGLYFNDSDVYKWLEAAAWTLAQDDDPVLRALVDEGVALIAGAQHRDGYLNTYFSVERADERWQALATDHELYCAGHLMQAAVAHFRASGEKTLLEVATRLAACIEGEFGWGKREEADGHEEIELALIELSRATGETRWRDLAAFFIDVRSVQRNRAPLDLLPFRELHEMTGHAVRALYLSIGGTDLFAETGEAALWTALEKQWRNLTRRRLYVSGGAGARWDGEAFGGDFELPQRAYAETCASVALVMWAWRMGQVQPRCEFFDTLELSLYNALLSGLSLDGKSYFYQNPLADEGTHRRAAWFDCSCCPANVSRLLAQLPAYVYSHEESAIWAHLYVAGRAQISLAPGEVVLEQETFYPWDGEVTFRVLSSPAAEWTLNLRVPLWAEGATVQEGEEGESRALEAGTYATLRRVWQAGDTLRLHLPMEPRAVTSHPHVEASAGRVAIFRGPLLFCAEECDHSDADVRDLAVSPDALHAVALAGELNGLMALEGRGTSLLSASDWDEKLYASLNTQAPSAMPTSLHLIPYFAWANRAPGRMQVWLQHFK